MLTKATCMSINHKSINLRVFIRHLCIHFCLGISLDGGVYTLSFDYKAIDVKHKLNSHEHHMNSV